MPLIERELSAYEREEIMAKRAEMWEAAKKEGGKVLEIFEKLYCANGELVQVRWLGKRN